VEEDEARDLRVVGIVFRRKIELELPWFSRGVFVDPDLSRRGFFGADRLNERGGDREDGGEKSSRVHVPGIVDPRSPGGKAETRR
jgi:hypothetical protein